MRCIVCNKPTKYNRNTTKSYACQEHMEAAGQYGYYLGDKFYISKSYKYRLKKIDKNGKSMV